MTKGCKIWLWFLLICNILSCVLCLTEVSSAGISSVYYVLACMVMIYGIGLLLFKQNKTGFYVILTMVCVSFVINAVNGVDIIYALVSAAISPAVTYFFIRKNSDVIK
ncbi:MAG: hypothetical protein LUD81_09830 [Clostridiales bacterium]|nr:hypothetical protein [Clostridiales bacterium]